MLFCYNEYQETYMVLRNKASFFRNEIRLWRVKSAAQVKSLSGMAVHCIQFGKSNWATFAWSPNLAKSSEGNEKTADADFD